MPRLPWHCCWTEGWPDSTATPETSLLLTCRFCCLSRAQEASFFSEEPEMPLKRSVSKVRHMTGSGWALAELTVDLWVTSHSNSDPSSYPANRRGPEVASVWSSGRMIREKMKTKRKEDVNAEWKHCVEVGAEWSRGYHPGSSCWHSRLLWAPFISPLCTLKKIHYGIAHFTPHLYFWPPVC